ncbi:PDR/VanB family oxidoreductase [Granulicoccus sp. GXG6511]|uniref:PDR/VanB family oxidoreductase n=1 Tax=Granulicoccus sp. GXG6511 TaxID=3381351 RepID=UPI003D7CDD72
MAVSIQPEWRTVRVVDTEDVAEGVRRVTFEYPESHKGAPGSHVDLRLPWGDSLIERSYSLVDSIEDDPLLTITVMLSPTSRGGSAAVHALRPGDQLEATQPLQNFPLSVGAKQYLLIAGGIGVTAVHAMAQVLKARGADYRFVYVGRSRAIMAYLDDLIETHGSRIEIHIDDEGSPLIVDDLLDSVCAEPAANSTELYLCGPIRLMDHVRRGWEQRHLPQTNLRFETFGNSGSWAPQDFLVRIPRLEKEIAVQADETMLEAFERSGLDVMFECRKGECGLCQVSILHVDGHVDHRDVFFSPKEKAVNKSACACVSRAVASGTPALLESDSVAQPEVHPGSRAVLTVDLT